MSSGCCSAAPPGIQFHQHGFGNGNVCAHPSSNSVVVLQSRSHRLAAAASSGASTSSSPYSEPLLGAEKKQKRRSVAGIDQDELVDPSQLADPDSCFLEFKGVQVHHKICEHFQEPTSFQHTSSDPLVRHQATKIGFPIILLHGFGASLFSWDRAMKPLAQATASKIVSFDRPAFGLTSRSREVTTSAHYSSVAASDKDVKSLNPFSMVFSVLATLAFIDFLAADKAILIGHSAGSLVALNTYFEAPERVAALVLVAPAILAPRKKEQRESNDSTSEVKQNPFIMISRMLAKISMHIARPIVRALKGMGNMISSLYKKVLGAFLRSTVAAMLLRMVIDKFGVTAVRNAWYDASKITDHVINGYIKPLRTKHWDRALLEYTAAALTDSEFGPPLSKRLSEISCPVLIISGDSDRIVPSWNAERLSQAIPGCHLEVINKCGHLPHEEKVEEFISAVQKFLQRVFAAPEEKLLQAAAT